MYGFLPLFDRNAARALDRRATALLGGDGYALMQRAGQAAWQHLLQQWPSAQRITVVCGPGNNGGDGYVLARLLGVHAGWLGRRWARRLSADVRAGVRDEVSAHAFAPIARIEAARDRLAQASIRAEGAKSAVVPLTPNETR